MTATLTQFKTRNQIYKDFKTIIQSALTEFTITGWDIKKLEQIIKSEELRPCVFMQILSKKQTGAQYRENIIEKNIKHKKYCKKQEITIRISATRREKINDTVDTVNGGDILDIILNYFQSLNGIEHFKTLGYAQYMPSAVQFQSFTNDDENIQIMPHFDITCLYTDQWEKQINKVDELREYLIKGV